MVVTLLASLIAFFSVYTPSAYAVPPLAPAKAAEAKAEAASFKFRGAWISPKIIQAFLPPASDPALPTVISIDVAAATGTNRFFGEISVKDGRVFVTESDESTIAYEWKGRTKNGKHLLVIRETSDGTMVPTNLGIFRIRQDQGLSAEGKKYGRVLLELDRLIVLGDRAVADVALKQNRATVKVSCENTCTSRQFTLDL